MGKQIVGATVFLNGPDCLVAGVSPVHISRSVEVGMAADTLSSIAFSFTIGAVRLRSVILTGMAIASAVYFALAVASSKNPNCLWYNSLRIHRH